MPEPAGPSTQAGPEARAPAGGAGPLRMQQQAAPHEPPVIELLERADLAMSRAGLADDFIRRDADRRPGRLSGGQCQRVLIAQAIVNEPRVLLMDEPTASLDPIRRAELTAIVKGLVSRDRTLLISTHDEEFARDTCTRVVRVRDGGVSS